MTIHPFQERLQATDTVRRTGRVERILATAIEASGPNVTLGTICRIESATAEAFMAEVVRVDRTHVVLSPLEDGTAMLGGLVTADPQTDAAPVGPALLGRAVDALGRPLDGLGTIHSPHRRPTRGMAPAPLERATSPHVLETGLRAVDGLLTLGRGQRIGIFAASGVGKTSLLNQFARQTKADVKILCLVGERGREVEAIWNHPAQASARESMTLVSATSDQSAAMRVRAAQYALSLAEYWRDRGRHVLLLLDSVTRLAMAMREIGLAAGEPPTIRGYTPGMFAALPRLVERCGALRSGGAITAVLTILSETDEIDDPVSELMKSLLDGHIVLSRALAEQGHFPAIDVTRSISRLAQELVSPEQNHHAARIVEWLSVHEASRALVETGLYAKGANPVLDRALEHRPALLHFLKQARDEKVTLPQIRTALADLVGESS